MLTRPATFNPIVPWESEEHLFIVKWSHMRERFEAEWDQRHKFLIVIYMLLVYKLSTWMFSLKVSPVVFSAPVRLRLQVYLR